MRRTSVAIAWLLGAIVIGCGRGSTPPANSTPSVVQPTQVIVVDQRETKEWKPAEAVDSVVAVSTEKAVDANAPPRASAPTAAVKSPPAEPAADDPRYRERLALLTPGGPLLVDVWITLDGRPHKDAFDARVKAVVAAGDPDGDGESTWQDLAANDKFLQSEGATAPENAKRRGDMWQERFDLNRDRRIDPDEAATWLGRDAGRSARPLALRSRRSYHAIASLGSRVWQLLDADRSGRLDGNETGAAPDRLLSLDANDDRIITAPELAPLRDQLGEPQREPIYASQTDVRHAALHLKPPADVDRLEYVLGDLYAPRHTLGPTSFRRLVRLFEELDKNGDRQLAHEELARLVTIEPHLALTVTFEKSDANGGEARLEVRHHAPEIDCVVQPSGSRAVLSLGDTRVLISAHDLAAPEASEPRAERTEVRATVHDECDALFEALDQNADGRLGEREITTSTQRILSRDVDGDGELAGDELSAAMVVAFLRSERAAEQSFYVPETAAPPQQSSSGPAWFSHADFNSDGDVSRREFLGSIEQFARLDGDQDGYLSAAEATASEKH